ncbi:MAG: exo-alpha-sialidase [Verrucomicrobia bacterium]|nr:exo-alpha-sialidase [Verrucomicrobiota bacterium]
MKTIIGTFVLALMLLAGCGRASGAAAGRSAAMVKLTQFDHAEFCDLAVGADGTLHAVFTDRPDLTKPTYAYYRASTDGGKSWSPANNLSDDESGNDAGFARLVIDGKGRLYALWKYVRKDELLDGPGGGARGILVYRCLEGGAWSKRVPLGDAKVATFSWFPALAPDGVLHVIWSQHALDNPSTYVTSAYANWVRQAALNGASAGSAKDLIVPKPLLTDEKIKAMRAAGQRVPYEETVPRQNGLINLHGYADAKGVAHFVAEHPGIQDGPSAQQTGRQIVVWDGAKLTPVYAFQKYQTYNNFNNPPALVQDKAGKPHLIRAPEKSEKPCVRDYPVEGEALGDFVNVIMPKSGPGKLANWQVHPLPGGRIAVTAALSEKGGYDPDDLELYVSFSNGDGKWSEPARVTSNQSQQSGFSKETVAGNTIGALKSYKPRFAAVAVGKDGKPCLLMVKNEDTIVGVTSPGVTSSGRSVTATGSLRVDHPAVYFLKF